VCRHGEAPRAGRHGDLPENTEDIYAGLEVEEGTPEAKKLIEILKREFGWDIRADSVLASSPFPKPVPSV